MTDRNHRIEEAARAVLKWPASNDALVALRAALNAPDADDEVAGQVRGVSAEPQPPISSPAGALTAEKADEQWALRSASRFRAFSEAMEIATKVRNEPRRVMDDSWNEAARIITNEIWMLQDKEVVKKATGGDPRGEATPKP